MTVRFIDPLGWTLVILGFLGLAFHLAAWASRTWLAPLVQTLFPL